MLIIKCRFDFLAWTMPLWLRLKRRSSLKRRRFTSDYSIVYFSYTIIPRFYVELAFSVTYLPFSSNSSPTCCCFLWETLRPSRVNALPSPSAFTSSKSWCSPFFFFLVHLISYCSTSSRGFNMPAVVSFNLKTSALLITLVLVPIVILCCSLAIALACSEFWSSRPAGYCVPRFCRSRARKRSQSDPERANSTEIPGFSATPSEYGDPVLAREQV